MWRSRWSGPSSRRPRSTPTRPPTSRGWPRSSGEGPDGLPGSWAEMVRRHCPDVTIGRMERGGSAGQRASGATRHHARCRERNNLVAGEARVPAAADLPDSPADVLRTTGRRVLADPGSEDLPDLGTAGGARPGVPRRRSHRQGELERELLVIAAEFSGLPSRQFTAGLQASVAERIGLAPKSLFESFIDVDGLPLIGRLVEFCRAAQRVHGPIWFQ